MLSFKQHTQLDEGNVLQQKVNKHVSQGRSIGALSPEGSHTDTPEKLKAAHHEMRSDLEKARKAGHIGGWSGPHKGEYRYASDSGEEHVGHEGSYMVHAKEAGKEHHDKMVHALSKIGDKHKQQSVLSVNHEGSAKWHHLENSPKKGQIEDKGKLKYNKPLEKDKVEGRTKFKSGHSFTSY